MRLRWTTKYSLWIAIIRKHFLHVVVNIITLLHIDEWVVVAVRGSSSCSVVLLPPPGFGCVTSVLAASRCSCRPARRGRDCPTATAGAARPSAGSDCTATPSRPAAGRAHCACAPGWRARSGGRTWRYGAPSWRRASPDASRAATTRREVCAATGRVLDLRCASRAYQRGAVARRTRRSWTSGRRGDWRRQHSCGARTSGLAARCGWRRDSDRGASSRTTTASTRTA